MQIFDYTDGRKGELVGSARVVNGTTGWLVTKGDKVFKVELTKPSPKGTTWQWSEGAYWVHRKTGDVIDLDPKSYGVEAVCFCSGEWSGGVGWQWDVVGTTEWNRQACQKGILKATYSHKMPSPTEEEVA